MPEDKRKIVSYVQVGMTRKEYEEDLPDGWDEMTEDEQQEHLDAAAETTLQNYANFGAYVDGEE